MLCFFCACTLTDEILVIFAREMKKHSQPVIFFLSDEEYQLSITRHTKSKMAKASKGQHVQSATFANIQEDIRHFAKHVRIDMHLYINLLIRIKKCQIMVCC